MRHHTGLNAIFKALPQELKVGDLVRFDGPRYPAIDNAVLTTGQKYIIVKVYEHALTELRTEPKTCEIINDYGRSYYISSYRRKYFTLYENQGE